MIKLVVILFGALKGGKLAGSALSMLLSLALYASVWGWRYAAGFVACLLLHELGHVIAAQQRGLAVSAPAFVPFMGAFITLREMPHDAETEAHVAIGGPLLGTMAAFAFYFAGIWGNDRLLLAIAYSGFVLNLFNLLPIPPLDGGRIVTILGPRTWLIGLPLLIGLFLYRPSPMLVVIAILAAPQFFKALRGATGNAAYFAVGAGKKLEYALMYLGLVAGLAIMSFEVHQSLRGF